MIFWNIITIKNNCFLFEYTYNVVYSCDVILYFQQPLLQSSVSRDLQKSSWDLLTVILTCNNITVFTVFVSNNDALVNINTFKIIEK